jgi:hypothetical protein
LEKEVTSMEEIRKVEELSIEELTAQTGELLPDREEMQVTVTAIGGTAATVVGNTQANFNQALAAQNITVTVG